jgi:predicted transcriptional regulator
MARGRSPALTDGELRIMRVLWERDRATVGDVVDALNHRPKPAYNTVLTMLRILERKGYVMHEKEGRAFTFVPLVDRGQARRHALTHLLTRFFDGSSEQLVLDLLGHDQSDLEELQRVRELIERAPVMARGRRGGRTRR